MKYIYALEPWLAGSAKIPSTAFCLLYKLHLLGISVKQAQSLITHSDSPYIRAIGFLYLRYATVPKDLWNWFSPYLEDEETIKPKGDKAKERYLFHYLFLC